ncbi:MAG: class II fructose-bisphosphate aldolase [Patescibacteria group bacterium]|nr:class II fructose-bisphosphate aldolase [Patescibacteria group bacterium]
MLVNPVKLFKKAQKGGYAIGAFNTSNVEITKAIIEKAEELKSPVIIETSEGEMESAGANIVAAEVKELARGSKIPIVLHLDHGKSFEAVREAVRAGYTSVHIDGSDLTFNENVELTKAVREYAHYNDVAVEGEIGHISGKSAHHKDERLVIEKKNLTSPKKAEEFVVKTKVDILAISIGNIHGIYAEDPKLDFKRLLEIRELVRKPFSLHGGSGIPKNQVMRAIEMGIVKVNVNTELRMAFKEGIMHEFDLHPDEVVPYKYLPAGAEAVSRVVEQKIRLFGSVDKA